jgi:hypothetical protein
MGGNHRQTDSWKNKKMLIIKKKQSTYYVKEESIVVHYGIQYISYNVYTLQNRKRFKDFKQALLESQPHEYSSISDIIGLGSRFGLRGMLGHKPYLNGNEEIVDHT